MLPLRPLILWCACAKSTDLIHRVERFSSFFSPQADSAVASPLGLEAPAAHRRIYAFVPRSARKTARRERVQYMEQVQTKLSITLTNCALFRARVVGLWGVWPVSIQNPTRTINEMMCPVGQQPVRS